MRHIKVVMNEGKTEEKKGEILGIKENKQFRKHMINKAEHT